MLPIQKELLKVAQNTLSRVAHTIVVQCNVMLYARPCHDSLGFDIEYHSIDCKIKLNRNTLWVLAVVQSNLPEIVKHDIE